MVISLVDLLMTEEAATVAAAVVYWTKKEAAKHARVTTRTITNWISREWLRAGGSPGKVLIRPEWLEDMLEHLRDGGQVRKWYERDGHSPDSDSD